MKPSPELLDAARQAFYNNQGDDADDPFELMLQSLHRKGLITIRKSELQKAYWFMLHEPGRVPERKGPKFGHSETIKFLRELISGRPTAHIVLVDPDCDHGPWFEDATVWLEMMDGRSHATARRHRRSAAKAHAEYYQAKGC